MAVFPIGSIVYLRRGRTSVAGMQPPQPPRNWCNEPDASYPEMAVRLRMRPALPFALVIGITAIASTACTAGGVLQSSDAHADTHVTVDSGLSRDVTGSDTVIETGTDAHAVGDTFADAFVD